MNSWGREASELGEFDVGQEVRRARMLEWTLKCATDPGILREPEGQHALWYANRPHR